MPDSSLHFNSSSSFLIKRRRASQPAAFTVLAWTLRWPTPGNHLLLSQPLRVRFLMGLIRDYFRSRWNPFSAEYNARKAKLHAKAVRAQIEATAQLAETPRRPPAWAIPTRADFRAMGRTRIALGVALLVLGIVAIIVATS